MNIAMPEPGFREAALVASHDLAVEHSLCSSPLAWQPRSQARPSPSMAG
jgi:hypothetical protein